MRREGRSARIAFQNQPAKIAERAAAHRAKAEAAMKWAAIEPAERMMWIERAHYDYQLARDEEGTD
jgi:hypothetical protein